MVSLRGASGQVAAGLAVILALSLLLSPAASLPSAGPPVEGLHVGQPEAAGGTFDDLPMPADPSCPDAVAACPWTDETAWIQWAASAGLEEIIEHTRVILQTLDTGLPQPDQWPEYPGLSEDERRAAWLGAWFQSNPAPPGEPIAPMEGSHGFEKILFQDGEAMQSEVLPIGGTEEEEEESKLGDARGLRSLWRLIEHGSVVDAHPADDEDAMALVTNRGVLHLPEPGEPPEWFLRVPYPMGASKVSAPGPDGPRLLGVEHGGRGYMIIFSFPGEVSIDVRPASGLRVFDLEEGDLVFEGFLRGEEQEELASVWTFTDVTGDGVDDLVVVTDQDELVAIDVTTGDEIFRAPLPQPLDGLGDGDIIRISMAGSPVFADATGDGIQDLYLVHNVYVSLEDVTTSQVMVTLVSGASGSDAEVVWQSFLDPGGLGTRILVSKVAGDVDGDGNADLLISEQRWDNLLDPTRTTVNGISGSDGSLLFFDDSQVGCDLDALCPTSYHPIAVVDLDADGRGEIIGVETEFGLLAHYVNSLVVRSLGDTPVPRTEVVLQENVVLPPLIMGFDGQMSTWASVDGAGGGILLAPTIQQTRYLDAESEGVEWVYWVDGNGFHEVQPPQALVRVTAHPVTGDKFGWILRDDHWTSLDEDLARTGDGFRLVSSVNPLVQLDRNEDGVPDFLSSKTAGYYWLSGRNGSAIGDVDRPWRNYLLSLHQTDDEILTLERAYTETGAEYRFGPLEGEPDWTLDYDELEGDTIRGVNDYTGDGKHELLVHIYEVFIHEEPVPGGGGGVANEEEPPRWFVRTPTSSEPLWEFEPSVEDYNVNVITLDQQTVGAGHPLLVTWRDAESDELHVALHEIGKNRPRWERVFGEDASIYTHGEGRFVVGEFDEEEETLDLHVHRIEDGQRVYGMGFSQEKPLMWARLDNLDHNGPHLIVSYAGLEKNATEPSASADPPGVEQHIEVRDADGDRITDFVTVDESGSAYHDAEEDAWHIQVDWGYSYLSGNVGDWDGDGTHDVALWEDGRVTARSTQGGSLLAVAPSGTQLGYSSVRSVDLNGDGRNELALRGAGGSSLTWYTYDAKIEKIDDEDDITRVDMQGDDNQTRDLDAFFDDPEDTPGPMIGVFILLLGAVLVGLRRGRRSM